MFKLFEESLSEVLDKISEDFAVGKDLQLYPKRPRSIKVQFYELPQAVQQAALQKLSYEDIESIQRWSDGYFISTSDGEYGFKEDGSDWKVNIDMELPTYHTSQSTQRR